MVRDKILIKEHLNQCFHWKSIIISTTSYVEIVFFLLLGLAINL